MTGVQTCALPIYVSIDYAKRIGTVIHRSGNLNAMRDAVARIRSGEVEDLSQLNYQELVRIEELRSEEVEPLRAQLDAFIHSIRTKTRPVVSAEDGMAAVETAKRIVESISPGMVL